MLLTLQVLVKLSPTEARMVARSPAEDDRNVGDHSLQAVFNAFICIALRSYKAVGYNILN